MQSTFAKTLTIALGAAVLLTVLHTPAPAQEAKPTPAPVDKTEAAGDAAAPDQPSAAPADERPAVPPEPPACVLSVVWLIVLLVSCALWVALADWVNRDAHELKLHREWWNLLMFGAGAAGAAVFWIGHAVFSLAPFVFGLIVFALYIPQRNKRVDRSKQVWTSEHLRLKLIDGLRRIGIRVNRRTFLRSRAPGQEVALLSTKGHVIETPDIELGKDTAEEAITCIKEEIIGALKRRATEIVLHPRGQNLRTRFRIDGILYDHTSYSPDVSTAMLPTAKAVSGIDTSRAQGPHVGGFLVRLPDRMIAIRSAVEMSVQGEAISLHIVDPTRAVFRLEKIGLPPETLDEVKSLTEEQSGLVLVCSPGENGKTTTLYAMIGAINMQKRKVITIEQPIECRLKGLTQLAVEPHRGRPFPKVLQEAVNQKPDVLVIGEIDGKESAHAALREANDGRLVLAAMRADSAVQGLQKLFEWSGNANAIGGAARGILAQRLVRCLCPACKQAFKPSDDLLKKISVTPEAAEKLYKAVGCPKCLKTGFFGRTGLFELLDVSDKIRAMIANEAPLSDILTEAQRSGHGHIWDDGITKLLDGVTSIQELVRVTKSK